MDVTKYLLTIGIIGGIITNNVPSLSAVFIIVAVILLFAVAYFTIPPDKQDGIYLMATYSAKEVEWGTGSPSSFNPCKCNTIASHILFSASSWVAPVATHPGKSGEYAE